MTTTTTGVLASRLMDDAKAAVVLKPRAAASAGASGCAASAAVKPAESADVTAADSEEPLTSDVCTTADAEACAGEIESCTRAPDCRRRSSPGADDDVTPSQPIDARGTASAAAADAMIVLCIASVNVPEEPKKINETRSTALPGDGVTSGEFDGEGVVEPVHEPDGVPDGVFEPVAAREGVVEPVHEPDGVPDGVFEPVAAREGVGDGVVCDGVVGAHAALGPPALL